MAAPREDAGKAARPAQLALTAFVEGLGPETSKEGLREHFADCGKILLAVIVADSETGNCVGKVKFSKELAVQKAIEEKSGTELDGRHIVVRDKPPAGMGEDSFEAGLPVQSAAVFVSNLNEETTNDALRAHFSACGKVVSAQVARARGTSRSHGYGRVEFASEAARRLAVQTLHDSELDGRRIGVKEVLKTGGTSFSMFVAGLRPEVRPEDLREHFSQSFTVLYASVQYDKNGLCKGHGKVEFASEEDRSRAMAQLQGSDLMGSTITLREFVPSSELTQRHVPREQPSDSPTAIFVGNLAAETTADALKQHFTACGQVLRANLFYDREGRPMRKGKLVFAKMGGYRAAMNKLNFSELDGAAVVVRAYETSSSDNREKQGVFSVWVGNISPETKASALGAIFLRFGRIHDFKQWPDGHCRIDYLSEEARRLAITELDGFKLDGKALSVRESRQSVAGGHGIVVANLGVDASEQEVKAHVQRYGEVAQLQLLLDRETGKPQGRARVEFASRQDKEAALAQLPNTTFQGRQLDVRDLSSTPGFSVFVAGLGWQTSAEEVRRLFGSAGEVKDCRLVRDAATGRSKGMAKVEYARKEDQLKAIQELHLSEFEGRVLAVREFLAAQAAAERAKKEVWPIFVSGLSAETTVKCLAAHFQGCGEVRDCRILTNRETGRSRGLGRVDFASEAGQTRAVAELHGTELDGHVLNVKRHEVSDSIGKPSARTGETAGFAVFAASLPFDTPLEAVKEHFSQAGSVVDARLILSPEGRSKGLAKVCYAQEKEANKAVAMLNDTEVDGRIITVRPFKEEGGGWAGQAQRAAAVGAGFTIFVSGLSCETMPEALKAHFSAMGAIRQCTILKDQVTGKSRGLAKVEFATEEAQQSAISKLHGSDLHGHVLTVRENQTVANGRLSTEAATTMSAAKQETARQPAPTQPKAPDPHARKTDPDDGKAYTFAELSVKYGGRLTEGGLRDLWDYDCADAPAAKPPMAGRPGPERRVDPEDNQEYTYEEFRARASAEGFTDEEIWEYWDEEFLPALAPVSAPVERRLDPEDNVACTFAELEAKLRGQFSKEEISEYWRHDCTPLAGGAKAEAVR